MICTKTSKGAITSPTKTNKLNNNEGNDLTSKKKRVQKQLMKELEEQAKEAEAYR